MPAATPHPKFAHFFGVLNGAAAPARVAYVGNVFRSALPRWMSAPYRLTGVGAVVTGGRWNVRNLMPALNFGTTAAVAAAEADAEAIRNGWPVGSLNPQTRVAFNLALHSVLDLTDAAVRKALGVTRTALTKCDWTSDQSAGREALTQAVARAAFETLAEGLIVPSARLPNGVNVVIFPAHLQPASSVTAHQPDQIPFVHGL